MATDIRILTSLHRLSRIPTRMSRILIHTMACISILMSRRRRLLMRTRIRMATDIRTLTSLHRRLRIRTRMRRLLTATRTITDIATRTGD